MASISRTSCPLATPPMAGLQDIWAIVFMFIVASITLSPILAAAAAASQPAWPAPYHHYIVFRKHVLSNFGLQNYRKIRYRAIGNKVF
jgi:hypothetical protein